MKILISSFYIQKMSTAKNIIFEEPITDINKNIDQIFESLNKLKLTQLPENSNTKHNKNLLEAEMQKILDLQNSIKHLKMYNDIVMDPFFIKEEMDCKSYKAPPPPIII
ncbi:uncharacterized protein LOC127291448 [Leptopilina boulardi]|uniref:uncharacterized protein LOC127291448 n=1 Tax=Leptopilina boulardi TaxID=63433 RepID=UPI0021F556E6|nr:uncharacterized protein LOC127291448 [Leptopilina boulardi]